MDVKVDTNIKKDTKHIVVLGGCGAKVCSLYGCPILCLLFKSKQHYSSFLMLCVPIRHVSYLSVPFMY